MFDMRIYFQCTVFAIIALLYIPHTYAATEITGTVTAKRDDSVQVTFAPHDTAGPKIGDKVAFSKEIPGTGGIKAKAGEGTVTGVDGATVWVKTTDNRPNLKMDAVIQATGAADLYPMLKNKYELFKETLDVNILRDLEKHARKGNADAQNIVGVIYVYGIGGVSPESDKGMELLQLAVAQGHAKAEFNLGEIYRLGKVVAQDFTAARKYYRMSAEQGHAKAQGSLGYMYDFGEGVSEDDAEAAKWYRKAAEQEDLFSISRLGQLYKFGSGVPKNEIEAVKLFRKAAEQGYDFAQDNLGKAYETGEGITQDFKEASWWYLKAAEQGYVYAQCNLGRLYESGNGVPEDLSEAIKWYQKAAAQKNEDAQKALKRLGVDN
jgi:TPR repeat protein